MQLIDAFATTPQVAAARAVEKGDLKALTRLLHSIDEGEVDIWMSMREMLDLALAERDMEAFDALLSYGSEEVNFMEGTLVYYIQLSMDKGDRVLVMRLWEVLCNWIDGRGMGIRRDSVLMCRDLVPKAIELGYPEILQVILYENVHDLDSDEPVVNGDPEFNQEKFDGLLSQAIALGEHDTWEVFAGELPQEAMAWAVTHDAQPFLRFMVRRAPLEDCIDQYEEAIVDGAALVFIEIFHAGCDPMSRQDMQRLAKAALTSQRLDVLNWLMTVDSLDDLPSLLLTSCDTADHFDVVCGLYGHRIPPAAMQRAFENACSRQWDAIAALILERYEVTQETLDAAFVELASKSHLELLRMVHSRGISTDRYQEAFKVTTNLQVAQFLISFQPPSRETAVRAVENCAKTRPGAVAFMEWVYDRYALTEKADVLLFVAGRKEAISFIRKLFPNTTKSAQREVFLDAVKTNLCTTVFELTSLMRVGHDLVERAMQLRQCPLDWAQSLSTSALKYALTLSLPKHVKRRIGRILGSRRR